MKRPFFPTAAAAAFFVWVKRSFPVALIALLAIKRSFPVALIALLASWPPAQAESQAQPRCDTRDRLVAYLAGKFEEVPVALALTDAGRLLELLASPDGATWSIVVTRPGGQACVIATGRDWRARRPAPGGAPL